MKYAVVLCDGMADYPVPALGGKTPMMVADKPNMDALAQKAQVGLVRTVAPGLKPGSDVANLSVLGYDPAKYHKGRSPLEAANLGVQMQPATSARRKRMRSCGRSRRISAVKNMIFTPACPTGTA